MFGVKVLIASAASLSAGLFHRYPVTGGFSRTVVNAQSEAKTPFASMITAVMTMVTLLALTPLLYFILYATLTAMIIFASMRLIVLNM